MEKYNIDQTVYDDDLAAGYIEYKGKKIDWNCYLFPADDERYPNVRDVSLTDSDGNELTFRGYHSQLINAVKNHLKATNQ